MPASRVRPLEDLPTPAVGAPGPILVANEVAGSLAYLESRSDAFALVRLVGLAAVRWGPPNDEARAANTNAAPLYGCFEIVDSDWLDNLRSLSALDPTRPDQEWAVALRHLQFRFHDSTLDLATEGYISELRFAPLREIIPELTQATIGA